MTAAPSDSTAGTRALFSPRYRELTVGLVATITLVALEALAIGTVMPLVARDLGGLELYGWVFSAFFLGSLVGIVVSGGALDRMPLRRPFLAGLLLFAVGLIAGGFAPTMPVLVFARFLQGLGGGAIPTTAYVAIARTLPEGLRPKMFAILSTAWVMPAVLGPAVAAVVGASAGWRWVFLGLVPFLVVAGAAALHALRDVPGGTRAPHRGASDDRLVPEAAAAIATARRLPTALLAAGGSTVFLAAIVVPNPLVVLGGSVIGLGMLVPAFARLTPAGTLGLARGLPAAVLLRGTLTFGFFTADAYLALLLQEWRREPPLLTALVFTTSSLAWSAGSWIQTRGIDQRGPRWYMRVGCSLVVAGILLTMPALLPGVPPAVAAVTFTVAGFGMGLAFSATALVVLQQAAPAEQGSASAALQLSDILGTALGVGIGGAVIAAGERAGGDALGWALAVTFTVAASVMAFAAVASARLGPPVHVRKVRSAAVD